MLNQCVSAKTDKKKKGVNQQVASVKSTIKRED